MMRPLGQLVPQESARTTSTAITGQPHVSPFCLDSPGRDGQTLPSLVKRPVKSVR
jgi:hypothetical protein